MISPVDIIGRLTYRTRESLNKNNVFLEKIKDYKFYDLVSDKGKVQLWHYPGTAEEISDKFLQMQDIESSMYKYPSVFNYQNVRQQYGISGGCAIMYFNIAFVAPTCRGWDTKDRNREVFDMILRDIYLEFFNQIKISRLFQNPIGDIPHTRYDVFTTGESVTKVLDYQYCDFMDAIQIINLKLLVKDLCEKDIDLIKKESDLVSNI